MVVSVSCLVNLFFFLPPLFNLPNFGFTYVAKAKNQIVALFTGMTLLSNISSELSLLKHFHEVFILRVNFSNLMPKEHNEVINIDD